MAEALLELNGVEARYGRIAALKAVSLKVPEGQIVALLGANGAGKSTTLRTISGLVRAAAGSIRFAGEEVARLAPHGIVARGLIQVPEGRRIFKGMSVEENLDLGAFTIRDDLAEVKRMKDHVFELFPRLAERKKQDAGLLSGGEQQMLAMGRAMMVKPRLLLLDEPSMGLAPFLVRDIMGMIKRLNSAGVTIMLVEQNAKEALKLAGYGYVLENGRIVLEGSGEKLARDESVVKAYLGG